MYDAVKVAIYRILTLHKMNTVHTWSNYFWMTILLTFIKKQPKYLTDCGQKKK